jgi:hypothetical protein
VLAVTGAALTLLPPAAGAKPATHGELAKVDSILLDLREQRSAGGDVRPLARTNRLELAGKGVLVDVDVKGDVGAAASALRVEGMDVVAVTDDPFKIVEGRLPLAALEDAASLSRVTAIRALRPPGVDIGSVTSEGDGAHRGPQARALGPTGAGVTVGVISDSMDSVDESPSPGVQAVSRSQADGDLPPVVDVLLDDPGGEDEGRAMAEIIYDGAPGIPRFVFSSGTTAGPVEKAQSINNLVTAGARIIADDIFMLEEPFFQDGVIAQAVDNARAAGVAYFASAGNRARQSYEQTYRDASGFHDFDPGPGADTAQSLTSVPMNGFLVLSLHWDEPVGAAQTDLDLRLVHSTLGITLVEDTTDNIANGIPSATVGIQNVGPSVPVSVEVERAAGSRAPFMKYIVHDNISGTDPIAEFDTQSDAINPDAAAARGSLATAAVEWSDPGLDTPEPFSSRGPKVRLFDKAGARLAQPETRQKPNIAGADGVSTGVSTFPSFFGTSAATPSAAGVGALILSAKPTNNADDVYAILQEPNNSFDCTLAGRPDLDCGMGFVLADNAVTRALDPTPPMVTASVNPATPNGQNGFYVKQDVTVSFAASDDGSPITSQTGCAPVTISTDTPAAGTTLTCSARSAGGTTSSPVTIKRDDTSPGLSALRARKRGTRVSFNLSEDATVTVTIERRRRGRFRRVRRFTVKGKQGKNSARRGRPKKAKAGRYRVKMQATDPAGNRSRVKRKKFRVRK